MKNPARKLASVPLALLFLHLASSPALGNSCVDTPIGCLPVDLEAAKEHLVGIMLGIVGLLALIMFTVGGYQVMTAGDDPEALREGRAKMTAALLGFIFLLLSATIIYSILGISII